MQIQKSPFKFKEPLTPLNLNQVNAIALHHMAHSTADEFEVERWHINNGWCGFGYNYWIDFTGRIIEGRGLHQAAGVKGNNSKIISIGFQGDYDKTKVIMPQTQYEAGVWLIQHLKETLPNIKAVDGHNRWNPTSCPGRYFPLKQMIDDSNVPLPKEVNKPVTIIVYGKELKTDVEPITINGRVMVPVRAIAESLGKKVNYDEKTKTVTIGEV